MKAIHSEGLLFQHLSNFASHGAQETCSILEFYISLNDDSHTEEVYKTQIVHHVFLHPDTPKLEYCRPPYEWTSNIQISERMEKSRWSQNFGP